LEHITWIHNSVEHYIGSIGPCWPTVHVQGTFQLKQRLMYQLYTGITECIRLATFKIQIVISEFGRL